MKSAEERFWEKVAPEPNTGCWLWTAGTYWDGYGIMGRGGRERGVMRAHRFSYELHNGPIPKGMQVLHRCDVPSCVNPAHLFLGTRSDNMRDMWAKGRQGFDPSRRGSQNVKAKLTEDDVREIRRVYDAGVPLGWPSEEARRRGVSQGAMSAIVNRRTWKHVA